METCSVGHIKHERYDLAGQFYDDDDDNGGDISGDHDAVVAVVLALARCQ